MDDDNLSYEPIRRASSGRQHNGHTTTGATLSLSDSTRLSMDLTAVTEHNRTEGLLTSAVFLEMVPIENAQTDSASSQ